MSQEDFLMENTFVFKFRHLFSKAIYLPAIKFVFFGKQNT